MQSEEFFTHSIYTYKLLATYICNQKHPNNPSPWFKFPMEMDSDPSFFDFNLFGIDIKPCQKQRSQACIQLTFMSLIATWRFSSYGYTLTELIIILSHTYECMYICHAIKLEQRLKLQNRMSLSHNLFSSKILKVVVK